MLNNNVKFIFALAGLVGLVALGILIDRSAKAGLAWGAEPLNPEWERLVRDLFDPQLQNLSDEELARELEIRHMLDEMRRGAPEFISGSGAESIVRDNIARLLVDEWATSMETMRELGLGGEETISLERAKEIAQRKPGPVDSAELAKYMEQLTRLQKKRAEIARALAQQLERLRELKGESVITEIMQRIRRLMTESNDGSFYSDIDKEVQKLRKLKSAAQQAALEGAETIARANRVKGFFQRCKTTSGRIAYKISPLLKFVNIAVAVSIISDAANLTPEEKLYLAAQLAYEKLRREKESQRFGELRPPMGAMEFLFGAALQVSPTGMPPWSALVGELKKLAAELEDYPEIRQEMRAALSKINYTELRDKHYPDVSLFEIAKLPQIFD